MRLLLLCLSLIAAFGLLSACASIDFDYPRAEGKRFDAGFMRILPIRGQLQAGHASRGSPLPHRRAGRR